MKTMMTIPVKCSWCNKDLGTKTDNFESHLKGSVTHGICEECRNKFLSDLKQEKKG